MPIKVEARMRMWAVIFLGAALCIMVYFERAPEPARISKTVTIHKTYTDGGRPMTTNKTVKEYAK